MMFDLLIRPEEQKPCCDCLEEPLNLFSRRPVKWEAAKRKPVEGTKPEAKDKGKAKSKGNS